MKKFELIRKYFTADTTIGELYLDNKFLMFILEDKDRMLDSAWDIKRIETEKVYGRTAIPTGEYKIEWTYSERFKKAMPVLLRVPGFEGIRIHAGNSSNDTQGCLIPGLKMTEDNVYGSRDACMKLYTMIKIAIDSKELVYINIKRKQ